MPRQFLACANPREQTSNRILDLAHPISYGYVAIKPTCRPLCFTRVN